jgi:hypothetical protein
VDCQVCSKLQESEFSSKDLERISSTIQDIDDFESNRVWRDISNTLVSWLIVRRDELETMGEGVDRNAISYKQGEIFNIRLVLNLPALMKAKLEEVGNDYREDSSDV